MVECISIQEEIEQGLIDKSVTINLNDCSVSVYLPFICDPVKNWKLTTILQKILLQSGQKVEFET